MKIRLARCAAFALILAVGSLVPGNSAAAAEPKRPVAKPVAFVSAASVERLIGEFDYVLDSIERPETAKKLREMRESATRLKGMGLDRPVGAMLLLDNFTPNVIGFIPIENRDDLIETLESYELGIEETDENEYLVRGGPKPLFAVVRERYAYVSDVQDALKKKFPDPEEYAKTLHGDYELALTAQLTAIPDYLRVFFTEAIRGQMDQQRRARQAQADEQVDESERALRLGENMALDGMSAIAKDADQITLGWSVSRQERQARLDFILTGMKNSPLAGQLNRLQSTESKMSRLVDPAAALRLTAAFDYNATFREMNSLILDFARQGAMRAAKDKSPEEQQVARRIADLMVKAFDNDRLDFGMQIEGNPGSEVVVYGWTSPKAEELRRDLQALKGEQAVGLEIIDQYRECSIYRTQTSTGLDGTIYGEDSRIYVTISKSVIWVALGGDSAAAALKKALDAEAAGQPAPAVQLPFEAVIRASKWKSMWEKVDEDARDILTRAFEKGDDRIRLELAGIENGLRFRATLGDAIIRVFGFGIVKSLEQQGLLGE